MTINTVYRIKLSKRYKKDIRRLQKSGRDLTKLALVINHLVKGKVLSAHYRDHTLKGNLRDTRECHIGPDWLLQYTKDEDFLFLILLRTSDHRRVLGIE